MKAFREGTSHLSLVLYWTVPIVQCSHSTTFRHLDLCSSGANVLSHLVGWVRRRPNLGTPYPILVRMVRMSGVEVRVPAILCMAMDSVGSFTPPLLYVLYRVVQNTSSNICATLYNLCMQLCVVCARALIVRVFMRGFLCFRNPFLFLPARTAYTLFSNILSLKNISLIGCVQCISEYHWLLI